MSNKNLLNETTIRRFMKLANINTLPGNFIKERVTEGDMPYNREDEDPMADVGMEDDAAPMDAAPMDDAPMDDAPLGDEESAEGGVDLTDEEASVLIGLGDKLSAAMPEAGAGELPGEEPVLDDEAPMGDEFSAEEEEPALEEIDYIDEDVVMEGVFQKVVARLVKENKQK